MWWEPGLRALAPISSSRMMIKSMRYLSLHYGMVNTLTFESGLFSTIIVIFAFSEFSFYVIFIAFIRHTVDLVHTVHRIFI